MADENTTRMLGYLQAAIHSQTAMQARILRRLMAEDVLSQQDVKELLDDALADLEKLQTEAHAHEHWIFEVARGYIEAALPSIGGKRS
ncbi:hypothetical protein ELG66_01565 [Rhizobium leguminosarum]|uniref:hypothetical protein n=1 Tax=Rhizobium leguminosarum TaxID=384 RepID=UPI00103206AB|nr:hypothetical protein [Rhizobium leguminosarum]TBH34697.1 hypothetical protein ELG66_01565 [Rhizobium leguminosarum]